MSGVRAKKRRRVEQERPIHLKNAAIVERSAAAILAVDLSGVVLRNRVPQVVVGLCRASAAQSRVIAMLTATGQSSSAAPNRRLFLEAAIRLIWMSSLSRADRRQAADIVYAHVRPRDFSVHRATFSAHIAAASVPLAPVAQLGG